MDHQKLDYIDAVRGWAILLVITCHVGGMFAELPYPVKKLTNFGCHGVQLFFLASAVTLLLSWNRVKERDAAKTRHFFLRRFFRIAPMYYAGALLYFLVDPPEDGFDLLQLLRTLLFVNVWQPEGIPTTPGWIVVPGGWSIGVEFTFYALFPILATLVTSLPRALLFFVCAMAVAFGSNQAGAVWLSAYSETASGNFLYFWFPNQMPVFALGFVLYFVLRRTPAFGLRVLTTYACLAALLVAYVALAEHPGTGSKFSLHNPAPPILLASLLFMVFILLLGRGPATLATHPFIRKIGVLSFSAYVLHFLFVHQIPRLSGGLIDTGATGYAAIASFALLWSATLLATIGTSYLAHRLIELPGVELGRRLTVRRGPRLVAGD